MSYVNLDLDVLCSRANPSSVHFVTREWEKAESPSIYWYRKFKEYDLRGNLNKISLHHHFSIGQFFSDDMVILIHGLPVTEALTMCKEFYKNNIAKVTIQISEDSVLMTTHDFSVTYAEQLSIISM